MLHFCELRKLAVVERADAVEALKRFFVKKDFVFASYQSHSFA